MDYKMYEYPNFSVEKKDKNLILCEKNPEGSLPEQKKLLNQILNFGYTPFSEGTYKISDGCIVDFWNFASKSVLQSENVASFYAALGFPPPYDSQIPTISEKGAFISDSFLMSVAWVNDTSSGRMASAPKKYIRDGLELFNFDEEKLGSIYPEYFELYALVDTANSSWKELTKTERFEFAKKIEEIGMRRKIVLPKSIEQALKFMQR